MDKASSADTTTICPSLYIFECQCIHRDIVACIDITMTTTRYGTYGRRTVRIYQTAMLNCHLINLKCSQVNHVHLGRFNVLPIVDRFSHSKLRYVVHNTTVIVLSSTTSSARAPLSADCPIGSNPECNFEQAVSMYNEKSDPEEFILTALGPLKKKCAWYCALLCKMGKKQWTILPKPEFIMRACAQHHEHGLLSLYLKNNFMECSQGRGSKVLLAQRHSTKPLQINGLKPYISLELAASVT